MQLAFAASLALLLAAPGAVASEADDPLSARADLDALVARALAHNADLQTDRARVRVSEERADVAGRLPDLSLRYQLWNAPVTRPWDPEMHMIGLAQEFPAPGSRAAREKAGQAETRMAQLGSRARELEIVAQLRRAYFELYRVDRERAIRQEHVRIAQRIAELTRSSYQTGRASQQDVLRAGVEVSRLQTDFAALDQARQSASALLNALVARPLDAPIGPAPDAPLPPEPQGLEALEKALESRPDLAAASAAVDRSAANLEGARDEARWPVFMLGADYMYSPMGEHSQHGLSVMLSVTLPWINGRHDHAVAAAEREIEAERHAREAALNVARFQLRDALARYRAAHETYGVLERDLLPQARQSFEAAESAFAANQGEALALLDAERSYLQVRIDRERAFAQLQTSHAELERALGAGAPHPGEK